MYSKRHRRGAARLVAALLIALMAGAVAAQILDPSNPAFAQAAIKVMTFDYLAGRCGGRWSTADGKLADSWQKTQGVDRIRARLRELSNDPQQQRMLEQARARLESSFAGAGVDHCASALKIVRMPSAQFVTAEPAMMAALSTGTASAAKAPPELAGTKTPTAAPATPAARAPDAAGRTALLREIDSFGFHSRPTIGVGGFVTLDIYPIVLFKNGDALRDIEALAARDGLEAHRRAKPKQWTRWRRSGGKVEVAGDEGWKPLHFQQTYPTLPAGFRLDGLYRSTSGTGNVAIGGGDSVAAWNEYTFSSGGRVVRGGGAGSFTAGPGGTVATTVPRPDQRGRYRVEGLSLIINFDDGSQVSRILVTDPKNPRAIWLDGVGYVRRSK